MSDPITSIPTISGSGFAANFGFVALGVVLGIIIVIITILLMFSKVFTSMTASTSPKSVAKPAVKPKSEGYTNMTVAQEAAENHVKWLQKSLRGY